ncbi:MAG: molybdenum cofactor guanylyltransferase [Actinomycetota bacterium]
MSCAGILLTGGASRRLGRDKATLVWRGETLAARAARVLSAVCDPVVEVGSGVSGLRCVREDPPGAGPLAALCAGARAVRGHAPLLLLACDMPFVDARLLQLLVDWPGVETAVPVADGRMQFACARLGAAALVTAAAALGRGRSALAAAFDGDCDSVPESIWRTVAPVNAFADVDTPATLASLDP